MDSASQSDLPPEPPSGRLSNLLGIFIAILTLTLPVFAIAHFSSARITPVETVPNPFIQPR